MIATFSAAGTDGFGVRCRFIEVIHLKIEMELLRHGIVGPSRRLVIHSQLESDVGARVTTDSDPVVLGLLDPPAK